jgi:hypothetical protein
MNDYREILNQRLKPISPNILDVESKLAHFALINYALPKSRLEKYIPPERFEIPEFEIGGEKMALMSAVPFLDLDFKFTKLFPFKSFRFMQTNFRVYVVDRQTGEQVVWFFGTTLGAYYVYIPKILWKIPWHYAKYQTEFDYDSSNKKYDRFKVKSVSDWCSSEINITDTGEPVESHPGFEDQEAIKLILTHPIQGFFHRRDNKLGTYSVWHKELEITSAKADGIYFSLYERLGLLSKEEMNDPVSIFICPEIVFQVILPPQLIK